jgi:hypothetical protein
MTPRLPRFTDEDAVAKLVNEAGLDVTVLDDDWIASYSQEAEAITAAEEHGNWEPLAGMVFWGLELSPYARNLAAMRMLGEFKRSRPGSPKKSIEARRRNSPAIGAHEDYELIWPFLRKLYPKERIGAIKARALQIAAQRAGIEVGTLINYRKSKRRVR